MKTRETSIYYLYDDENNYIGYTPNKNNLNFFEKIITDKSDIEDVLYQIYSHCANENKAKKEIKNYIITLMKSSNADTYNISVGVIIKENEIIVMITEHIAINRLNDLVGLHFELCKKKEEN